MHQITPDRARWLTRSVLPHEASLRAWLDRKQIHGIDVDDIVQETYAKLAALDSVADIRNPRAYIYQTAFSIVLIYLRRARIVSFQAVPDLDQLALASDAPSPEAATAARQELQRLVDGLDRLPTRCREVFVLRKVHGLSQREVASHLGISEGTVEKHVHKGMEMLGRWLGRGGNPDDDASIASVQDDDVRTASHGVPRDQRGNRQDGRKMGRQTRS